jgi:hypothetical protein
MDRRQGTKNQVQGLQKWWPKHIRSANGSEFIANAIQGWLPKITHNEIRLCLKQKIAAAGQAWN